MCERGDTGFPIGTRTFYRSIGTAPDYGTNTTICPTCTVGLGTTANSTRGSRIVTGNGHDVAASNRGRGDVMQLGGGSYMVKAVLSDTELVLEQPVTFGAGAGLDYSLRRQETRLQDWANCIAQTTGGICRFFDPPSADLVSDDRAEVGVAYADSPFLHSDGGHRAGDAGPEHRHDHDRPAANDPRSPPTARTATTASPAPEW